MPETTTVAVLAALTAGAVAAGGVWAVWQWRRARRALLAERAARRVTEAARAREETAAARGRVGAGVQASARMRRTSAEHLVLAEAARILDDALVEMARNSTNESGGGDDA